MSHPLTIWLLQTGEPLHTDTGNPRPMRAMNLANALVAAGHKVVLWSSSFYHQEKRHRVPDSECITISASLEIRLLASPGYRRNIGPGRLWDHAMLARNLGKALSLEAQGPDVAFAGYPPIETAAVMARWLAERRIPFMVDVKDQWPTIFTDPLPAALRPLGRLALAPYFYYGKRALRDASGLSAMAGGFLQWAAEFAGRSIGVMDRVVPLTVPTGQISLAELEGAGRWWDAQGILADGTPRLFFVGSHSSAFDMEPIAAAARALAQSGSPCQIILCGEGEYTSAWKQQMGDLPTVYFPGWIDRSKIEALALRSTAALAPYRNGEDFMMSIPNKVVDALALGLPILSPLKGEVQHLIASANIGMSYGASVGSTLEQCVADLTGTAGLRDELSANALSLFQKQFSFETVYGGLVKHLELLARDSQAGKS